MRTTLFIFLLFMLAGNSCATSPCVAPIYSSVIYFGNGINTDRDSARSSLSKLKKELTNNYNNQKISYALAYNSTSGMGIDLAQAAAQSGTQNNRDIIRWLNGKNLAPIWFSNWFESYLNVKGSDIATEATSHAKFYLNDILDGKKVVVVSHSQGNFYVNEAKELLARQLRNGKMSSFVIFGVAVPANSIGGATGPYLTNHRDFIQKVPFSLPSNWKLHHNDKKVADDIGAIQAHLFNATYLSDDFDIKPALIAGIRAQIDAAVRPVHSCENFNQVVSALVSGEYINTCEIGTNKVHKQFFLTPSAIILSDGLMSNTSGTETQITLSQRPESLPNVIQFGAFGGRSAPAIGAAWDEGGVFRSGRPPLSCHVDEKTPRSWISQPFNITKTMLSPLQGLYRIVPKDSCRYDRDRKNDKPLIFSIDESAIRLGDQIWPISSDSETVSTYDFSFVTESQGQYINPGRYTDPGFLISFDKGNYSFGVFYNRNREITRFTAVETDKSTVSCDFL